MKRARDRARRSARLASIVGLSRRELEAALDLANEMDLRLRAPSDLQRRRRTRDAMCELVDVDRGTATSAIPYR